MKKIMMMLAAALVLAAPVFAQDNYTDERGRVTSTIVADVLAQMPSQSEAQWAGDMSDLVQAAPASIEMLGAFLGGESKSLAEYALKGVSDYVSAGLASGEKVREGLAKAIVAAAEPGQRAFLVSVLAPIATQDDVALLQGLVPDSVCGPYATAALESLGVLVRPAAAEPLADASSPQSALRCAAAIDEIDGGGPGLALKIVRKALKSDDRALRVTALNAASARHGAYVLVPTIEKAWKKLPDASRADVLYWAGDNACTELLPAVTGAVSAGGEVTDAALYAAAKIGGSDAVDAIISQVGGEHGPYALKALGAAQGDVQSAVKEAIADSATDPGTTAALLRFAGAKRMKGVFDEALSLFEGGGALKDAAAEALYGVGGPDDAGRIAALLERAPESDVPALQKALFHSLSTLPDGQETAVIKGFMEGSKDKSLYYPVLALCCTDASISTLRWYYQKQDDLLARKSLLEVNSISVVPDLQKAAKEGGPMMDTYIRRYLKLQEPETDHALKRGGIELAIALTDNESVKADAIGRLGRMYDPVSFAYAGTFLDDESLKLRYTAAKSVRDIAAHSADIKPGDLRPLLGKAAGIFAANGTLDDGYAVKQIEKILQETAEAPISKLTAEEEAAGFEMLFDGSDLSKWHGNREGYIPVNGTIYVSAGFGADGNLYTNKEYRNFIYRFEFCFLRRGINNGVGLRTRDGVDAAYDGMCEVQILDHDAPMYGGLRDFQVHGSAYGLVPAKRIKHKEIGEWSTEEIKVVGDHITVTVNGEVILDTDLREVCQGHNVAPDGSKNNPYTADRHNHPGMFNERGYISFCGHGEGLKIRNVRILELPD